MSLFLILAGKKDFIFSVFIVKFIFFSGRFNEQQTAANQFNGFPLFVRAFFR